MTKGIWEYTRIKYQMATIILQDVNPMTLIAFNGLVEESYRESNVRGTATDRLMGCLSMCF